MSPLPYILLPLLLLLCTYALRLLTHRSPTPPPKPRHPSISELPPLLPLYGPALPPPQNSIYDHPGTLPRQTSTSNARATIYDHVAGPPPPPPYQSGTRESAGAVVAPLVKGLERREGNGGQGRRQSYVPDGCGRRQSYVPEAGLKMVGMNMGVGMSSAVLEGLVVI